MTNGEYTYFFGKVFDDLLSGHDMSQSAFARECTQMGRKVLQQSVSDWIRGEYGFPPDVVWYAAIILRFDREKWTRFALAYTYGQTVRAEDAEDIEDVWEQFRQQIADQGVKGDGA